MRVAEALNKRIFWDTDPDKLDWDKNKQLIIERALIRGQTSDVKMIFKVYSKKELINVLQKSKVLTPKVANFMSVYLNIPLESIHVAPEHY